MPTVVTGQTTPDRHGIPPLLGNTLRRRQPTRSVTPRLRLPLMGTTPMQLTPRHETIATVHRYRHHHRSANTHRRLPAVEGCIGRLSTDVGFTTDVRRGARVANVPFRTF